jgi:lysophospholipase L1-like esterase
MSRLLVSLAAVLVLGVLPCALHAADGPTPYPDAKDEAAWPGKGPIRCFPYMAGERKAFWGQRQQDQGKVVFAGDSLVGGWKDLGKFFPKLKIANRGVGGDTSRGILFRFQEDVVDLHPKAVVITAGANDLSAHGEPANTVVNISAMVDLLRKQDPTVAVVICTIPPQQIAGWSDVPGARQDLRQRILAFAKGKERIVAVDLFPIFALPDDKPNPELFNKDMVHPNDAGHVKWAAVLTPVFEQLQLQ